MMTHTHIPPHPALTLVLQLAREMADANALDLLHQQVVLLGKQPEFVEPNDNINDLREACVKTLKHPKLPTDIQRAGQTLFKWAFDHFVALPTPSDLDDLDEIGLRVERHEQHEASLAVLEGLDQTHLLRVINDTLPSGDSA